MKINKQLTLIIGLTTAALLIVAAVIFQLPQYRFGSGVLSKQYNGFLISFGDEYSAGTLLFFITFLFSIFSAILVALETLGVFKKVRGGLLSGIATFLTLLSVIFFCTTMSFVLSKYNSVLAGDVHWLVAFWFGLVFNIIALFSSAYLTFIKFKK